MEQQPYNVLLIDDNSQAVIASLEPAANAFGFEIYSTESVLEGLEFLESYSDTVDAIILDLCFPKGEIQGLEALEKLKKSHPQIPVIMLTDSDDSGDIDKVVECIKKGAYNYVGKRKTFNPIYLFQVVEAALKESKLQLQLKIKNEISEKNRTFFTLKNEYKYGRFRYRALFGFELISINRPNNEEEEEQGSRSVLTWHENLLKSISFIYRDEVQVNLKYISENGNIRCKIIFTVYAVVDEELNKLIASIQHDLIPFFSRDINTKNSPYLFEEISDETELLSANEFSVDFKYNLFFRKPLKPIPSNPIGFSAPKSLIKGFARPVGKIQLYFPDELFPPPGPVTFDNELFRALCNQTEYTEIDVQLMPKGLMKEEIDFIRQAIKYPNSSVTNELSVEEGAAFTQYLQKFSKASNDKFLISVILKRKSANWEQHLKTALQNYFFGFHTEVQQEFRKPENMFRYQTSVEGASNQLPFFYSIYDAIQAFRLPVPELQDLPGIKQQASSFHYIPRNVHQQGILLGRKKTVSGNLDIRISKSSLARHIYIMGQTGTGKSTLLKTMIEDCLVKNEGLTVIDPHGDLYDEVLKMIPKGKRNKLLVINATDPDHTSGLNPLSYDENIPQAKSLVINELIRVFYSLYDMKQAGGPMFELYLKNGLYLVLDEKVQAKFGKGTLIDFVKIFFSNEFRKERLNICSNQSVKDFFVTAEANSGDWSFPNFATYVTSKLTRFVDDFYIAPLLSSRKNIDFRKVVDDGNILLVRMDKGLIGTDNVSLLGQLVLSNIILAGMSRANVNAEARKPHYIFIDEFQNFVRGDVGSALSEVRKYGLNLILANQTISQLDDRTRESLLGNAGSLIFFRPGVSDYEIIKHYLEPEFTRSDVLKLPNFHCIGRLLMDNVPSEPFVFQNKYE